MVQGRAKTSAERLGELRFAMSREVTAAEEELSMQQSRRSTTMRELRAEVDMSLNYFRDEASACAAEGRRKAQEDWTAKRLSSQATWKTALRAEDEAMRAQCESLEHELGVWRMWSERLESTSELTEEEQWECRKALRLQETAASRREELAELAAAAAAAASKGGPRLQRAASASRRRPAAAAR